MTTIQSIPKSHNNYDSIEIIEKSIDQIDEKKLDEQSETSRESAKVLNDGQPSTLKQGTAMRPEDVVEKHLSQVNEYAQKIKEKIMVSELQDSEHYGKIALEVKKTLENLINVVTEEDIQNVLKDQYDPNKLSIDMLARVINQNKLAYRTSDLGKIQKEIDEAVETFKIKFSNIDHLKQAVYSLKENSLPVNQKNLDKIMQVVDKVEEIKRPNNQTLVNLLIQKKPITIENLYKAKYTAEKTIRDKDDLKVLEPQIEKILKDANVKVTKESIQLSKMFIHNDIPLNEEILTQVKDIKKDLKDIDFMKVISQAAVKIASKKSVAAIPIEAITHTEKKVVEDKSEVNSIDLKQLVDRIQDIETIHIEKVVNKNKTIHLQALIDEVKNKDVIAETKTEINTHTNVDRENIEINSDTDVKRDTKTVTHNTEKDIRIIKASLQLEEIRLKMTFEAANRLSDKGIDIAIEPLENLVNHLKELEREVYVNQLVIHDVEVTKEQISKVENVFEKIDIIRHMPPKVFAKVINQEIDFSIKEMANETRSELVIEKAMKNYELLGTKPRSDLGDRIEKAFHQIEGILEELKIDPTQSNIRAAKILAKNEMPITVENLEAIKIIDLKVIQVTEELHPSIVVNMIKNKLSPLDMHVDEVLQYMEDFKRSMGITSDEQVENAIYALDANKILMPEERDSLIGIYRMFSTIAKSQGTAVGFLIKNNLPLSLNHLFEAAKYIKQTKGESHIKVNVDDNYGILSEVNYKGRPIKDQIETAISKDHLPLTKNLLDLIEGLVNEGLDIESNALRQAVLNDIVVGKCIDNMSYDKMIDLYREGCFDKEIINIEDLTERLSLENHEGEIEVRPILEKIKNLSQLNVDVLKTIEKYGIEKTLQNLLTVNQLKENPFELLDKLDHIKEAIREFEQGNVVETLFKDNSSEKETSHFTESYEDDIDKLKRNLESLKAEIFNHPSNLRTNLAKNVEETAQILDFQKAIKANDEYYQIPFMIGDKLSQINMYYFKDKKGHKAEDISEPMNIHLYFHTENMGKVQANIRLHNNKLDFNIYAKDTEDLALIKSFSNKINEILSHTEFAIGKVGFDFFEGKSPIQEAIKPISQETTKKHQESKFETVV